MKALQYIEKEQPAVTELPVPDIAEDEVLVAARSVGVCHSDIELLEGRYITLPVPANPWTRVVGRSGQGGLKSQRPEAR